MPNIAANLASQPSLAAKRAAALAAGYVLVPVPLRLRLREAANQQRGERARKQVAR